MPAVLESPKTQTSLRSDSTKYVPRNLTILDQGRVFELHGHVGPWDKDCIDPESGMARPYRLSEYEFRRCTLAITASPEYGPDGRPKLATQQEIDEYYDGLIKRLLSPTKKLRLNTERGTDPDGRKRPPEYEPVDSGAAMVEVTHTGVKPDPRQVGANPPAPYIDPHIAQQELIAEKTAQVLRDTLAMAGEGKGKR